MDAGDDRNRDDRAAGGGCLLEVLFGLLALAWAFGTPVLGYGWMFAAAPLFGEQPTAAELAEAHRLLLGALACGFVVPFVGLMLAAFSGRGWAAAAFAGALGLSVLAAGALGLLSRDSLRSLRDELLPPTSTSVQRPIPCQEHSGGGNRCPGG
jgi:cobalamin biosynthesis protein CobD/CbiB